MNYEEKYKEALAAARSLCKLPSTTSSVQAACEVIFPELMKTEDEKIMEELISLVKYTKGRRIGYEPHITQDEMIAWLEKQGEKTPVLSEEDERIKEGLIEFFRSQEILYDKVIGSITTKEVLAWLEKQGKQKTDKVEPKFKVGDIV